MIYPASLEEANRLIDDSVNELTIHNVNDNMNIVYTSVILSLVEQMTPILRLMMTDLTGVSLETPEEMYDYLTKSLNLNSEKSLQYGLTLVAQNGDLGNIEDLIQGMKND